MGIYNNPSETLADYERHVNLYRQHLAGAFEGKSLGNPHWREVSRQRAVKMGNIYRKLTGRYPNDFGVVNTRRRDYG
jgi:hypothetical protein